MLIILLVAVNNGEFCENEQKKMGSARENLPTTGFMPEIAGLSLVIWQNWWHQ